MSSTYMPPSKYIGEIRENDSKYENQYAEYQQYTTLVYGSIKIMIGSFVEVEGVKKIDAPGEVVLPPPKFAQIYRILKSRKGPIILAFWYHSYSNDFEKVQLIYPSNGRTDHPAFSKRDVFLDRRCAIKFGILDRANIAAVKSMVKLNYMDNPFDRMKESKTEYAYRFDLAYSKGRTIMIPRIKPTNLKEDTYSEEMIEASHLVQNKPANSEKPTTSKTQSINDKKPQPLAKKRIEALLDDKSDEEHLEEEKSDRHRKEVGQKPPRQKSPDESPPSPQKNKNQEKKASQKAVPDHPAFDKPKKVKLFSQQNDREDSFCDDDIEMEVAKRNKKKGESLKQLRTTAERANQSKMTQYVTRQSSRTMDQQDIRDNLESDDSEEDSTPGFGTSKKETKRVKNVAIVQRQTKSLEEAEELFEFDEKDRTEKVEETSKGETAEDQTNDDDDDIFNPSPEKKKSLKSTPSPKKPIEKKRTSRTPKKKQIDLESDQENPPQNSDSEVDEDDILFNTPKKRAGKEKPSTAIESDEEEGRVLRNSAKKRHIHSDIESTNNLSKKRFISETAKSNSANATEELELQPIEKKSLQRTKKLTFISSEDEDWESLSSKVVKKRTAKAKVSLKTSQKPKYNKDPEGTKVLLKKSEHGKNSSGSESEDLSKDDKKSPVVKKLKRPKIDKRRNIHNILSSDESDEDDAAKSSNNKSTEKLESKRKSRHEEAVHAVGRLGMVRVKNGTKKGASESFSPGDDSPEGKENQISEVETDEEALEEEKNVEIEEVYSDATQNTPIKTALKEEPHASQEADLFVPIIRPEGVPIGSAVKLSIPKPSSVISEDEFKTPPSSPPVDASSANGSMNALHSSKLSESLKDIYHQSFQSLMNIFVTEKNKVMLNDINSRMIPMDSLDDNTQLAAELEKSETSHIASKAKEDSETSPDDGSKEREVEKSVDGTDEISDDESSRGKRTPRKRRKTIECTERRVTRNCSLRETYENEFNVETYLEKARKLSLKNSNAELDRVGRQCLDSVLSNDVLRAGSDDEFSTQPSTSKQIPQERVDDKIDGGKELVCRNLSIVLDNIDDSSKTASEVEESDDDDNMSKRVPTILRPKKTSSKPSSSSLLQNSPSVSAKKGRKEKLVPKELNDEVRINGRIYKKFFLASPAKDGSLRMRIRSPDKSITPSFQEKMKQAEEKSEPQVAGNKNTKQATSTTPGKGRKKVVEKVAKAQESPAKSQKSIEQAAIVKTRGGRTRRAASESPTKTEERPARTAQPLVEQVELTPRRRGRSSKSAAETPSPSKKLAVAETPPVKRRRSSAIDTSPESKEDHEKAPETPKSARRGRPPKVAETPPKLAEKQEKAPETPKSGKRGRPPKASSSEKTPTRASRRSLQAPTPEKTPSRRRVSVAPKIETVAEEGPATISNINKKAAETVGARSGRQVRTPRRYRETSESEEEEVTPEKPKKRGRPAFKTSIQTPKVGRGRPRKGASTPSRGTATPSRTPRKPRKLAIENNDIEEQKMPGREDQMANIQDFIESRLEDQTGGCMYISGLPGTGKTASVNQVLLNLFKQREAGEVDFKLIQVSGMELTQPQQVFCRMAEILLESKMTPAIAQASLAKYFSNKDKKRAPTILLIDELDMLCTRKQDVVYHLFDWPTKATSKLIVLTIANTMDLPERLLQGKVTSRMGLTRLTFRPYTYDQLEKIVQVKLGESGDFDSDARQLVARKVASLSGDARRALEICRRALELADNTSVQMSHVMRALKEMLETPTVEAIKNLSPLEKLFMNCMASEIQRTGVEETTLGEVLKSMRANGLFHGVTDFSNSKVSEICARLASCRLVLAEQDRAGMRQRISLNVNPDDLHYALKVSNQL